MPLAAIALAAVTVLSKVCRQRHQAYFQIEIYASALHFAYAKFPGRLTRCLGLF